jgi:hypothetical protein
MIGDTLIYLATPYSHPDAAVMERRFREVTRVAGDMMRRGDLVFSPISHTHPIALVCDLPKGWDYWQSFDKTMLRACGRVVVLMQDGWEESVGVRAEIAMAQEMGIPVEYREPLMRQGGKGMKVCGNCKRRGDDTCPRNELRYWAKICRKFKKRKKPKRSSACPCCGQSPCSADPHGQCRQY